MSRSVQNPKTLTPLIDMITPRAQFIKAKAQMKSSSYYLFWGIATIAVVAGQFYVGNGYRRMADTNDAISADINLLIEYLTVPQTRSGTGGFSKMPIIGSSDDYIIWEQTEPEERIRRQDIR